MARLAAAGSIHLAELLAAMSLAADLGNDFPAEKGLRTCVLAMRLGAEAGLSPDDRRHLYFAALLRFTGCTSYAHELGERFGDDNHVRGTMATVDAAHGADMVRAVRELGRGRGLIGGVRAAVAMMRGGEAMFHELAAADCEVSSRTATRLGVGGPCAAILSHSFARWDGKGAPKGLAGDAIDLRARVLHVAHIAELLHHVGGRDAAREGIARGAEGWFDPAVADAFARRSDELLEAIEGESAWEAALEAEPRPRREVAEPAVDDLAATFADLVDLKSSYRLGHSSGVARLVERALVSLNVTGAALATARRAALLHDLGTLSIPTGILDKKGALSASEWERVRLHAYHTERALSRSPVLAEIARTASLHHERLDGKGYHRQSPAAALSMPARVLAAADVMHALLAPRPHRERMTLDAAAKELREEVARGALDREAVAAVCEAAGAPAARVTAPRPGGLSEREVEVLRLLARGLSKGQIAKSLFIAPGTVHTHVTHIYDKLGVTSRAAAALFAMENGLLPS